MFKVIVGLYCILVLSGCSQQNGVNGSKIEPVSKPNIIFMLVDDMGYMDVGYQDSEIKTPNIDALAASGIKLERAYAFPVCSPTRAALMTGQNPLKYGVDGAMENDAQLSADLKLLPEFFKESGYQTWMVGKWHLGMAHIRAMPHNRGFDYFYGSLGGFMDFYTHVYFGGYDFQRNGTTVRREGYATHLQTDDALNLIQNHDGNSPFFMYLSFNSPHTPLQHPPNMENTYSEIQNSDRRVFAQMMSDLDASVGKVVRKLEAKGMRDDTLIVFMSDNGGNLKAGASNGELRGSKGDALEGGIRVPAIVSWPTQIAAAQSKDVPIFAQDWLPTLLEATGSTSSRSEFEGVSAWSSLRGKSGAKERPPVIIGTANTKAVFEWPMKMIRTTNGSEPDVLYDVVTDPLESNDLSARYPELVIRLGTLIDALPKTPSKAAKGPKPESLFRDEEGNFDYDIRKPETREPWAESAVGSQSSSAP